MKSFAILALSLALLGARCGFEPARPVETPEPRLLDERGEVDREALDALIAAIEERRGLRFVRRPSLELGEPGEERFAALKAEAAAREPFRTAESTTPAEPAPGSCFPDLDRARVACVAPPSTPELLLALARILDAQHYPRLAASAPTLRGDIGIAVRALLAASAGLSATDGFGPPPTEPWKGPLERDEIGLEGNLSGAETLLLASALFLGSQRDREAPFRSPPLSTKQILSPRRYAASERPLLLVGARPALQDCEIESDESIGVARLLERLAARNGHVPSRPLAAWRGDRGVMYGCQGGAGKPWLYVVLLEDDAAAQAFSREAETLLPPELEGPFAQVRLGRRVAAWRHIPDAEAKRFAAALESRELTGF